MPNTEQAPKLTDNYRKLLSALLAAGRALTNAELKDATGVGDPGGAIARLAERPWVITTKRGRSHAHELTKAGREVASALTAPPPPPPPPPVGEDSGLNANQVLALVVLMAEARSLSNKELEAIAGFGLTGKDNAGLEQQGLVETDRRDRPFTHQLTDKGWRFVRELHTKLPPRAGGSAIQSVFALLSNVHRALDRLQLSYAEFFKQTGEVLEARGGRTIEPAEVEARIRSVYRDLAPAPGDWVGLADMRERLVDLEASIVDAALHLMRRKDDVRIIPVANTKALEPRDHKAALRIGNSDAHAIAIGQT